MKSMFNPNAIEIVYKDGTQSPRVEIQFPIGHPRRRREGIPLLVKKFETNLARRFAAARQREILELCLDHERLTATPVHTFTDLFAA